MEDLQQAVRQELKLPPHQQAGWKQSPSQREAAFAFPSMDGGELVTRWDMQITPPDILITNISMLNAMLSRSSEQQMLEQTRQWLASDPRNRFTLVIDELHLQRGSEGTEFMYLLRLLLVRLGLDQPERHHQLRLLASSASLPATGVEGERSLDFLRDAFADFGLPAGSEQRSLARGDRARRTRAENSALQAHGCCPATRPRCWRPARPFWSSDLAPADSDALLALRAPGWISPGAAHQALLKDPGGARSAGDAAAALAHPGPWHRQRSGAGLPQPGERPARHRRCHLERPRLEPGGAGAGAAAAYRHRRLLSGKVATRVKPAYPAFGCTPSSRTQRACSPPWCRQPGVCRIDLTAGRGPSPSTSAAASWRSRGWQPRVAATV